MSQLHSQPPRSQTLRSQTLRSQTLRSRLRQAAAAALLVAVAILATATPASAHDSLINSTPAPGERLDVAPSNVALTFSNDVLTLGAVIMVVDESGRDWALPDPVFDENTVSATLAPDMPEAGFELRWRVVSADGHPISGVIPFTIGDGNAVVGTPETGTPETGAPEAGTTTPQTRPEVPLGPGSELGPNAGVQTLTCRDDAGDILRSVAIGIGGAALALGIAMLVQFIRRRTLRTETGAPAGAPTQNIEPGDTSGSHTL